MFISDGAKSRRTDFSNIMNEISNDQSVAMKTRSKKTNKKPNDIGSGVGDVAETKDSSEEDVVGPLCTSMKKLSGMTGQNYEQLLKTPSETSVSNKSGAEPLARSTSFRKSLVFDSGLTPHDNESAPPGSVKSNGNESGERPKAKTSLTFSTEPTISVRSFYGKSTDKPATDQIAQPKPDVADIAAQINNHKLAAAIAKHRIKTKPKSKAKSLAKRMKAPSLWQFSGKMKFNRFKRHIAQKNTTKKKLNSSKLSNKAADDTITNDLENVPPIGSEFTSRIEQNLRLQKIMKDQANSLSASRDINWNGCPKSNDTKSHRIGFSNSDGEDEDDDGEADGSTVNAGAHELSTYEEVEVEVEEPSNRKFFKSSASNSAKKYRIMGRLSATLKRGGDLKFDPLPKRKKRRPNKGSFLSTKYSTNNVIHLN